MDEKISLIIKEMTENSKGCEDKCVDLQNLKFEVKEGEVRLYNDFKSYYFKSDPEKPKHPKVVHATKQFCKKCGIPYSFFAKNPEYMKNNIVGCWLPTLNSDNSAVLAKLRKTPIEDNYIIRAILPVEYTCISNLEVLSIVSEAIGDDFRVEFATGYERDDLIFHIRLISNDTFEICGETCATGFSVIASELGESPISVETMLYRDLSKTAMIANYNGESFFEMAYEGVQPSALKDLFPKLVTHLKFQLCELKAKIQDAKELIEKKDDLAVLLKDLRIKKGLNTKFHTLLLQEIEKSEVNNRWDFVNRMAIIAKNFDAPMRVKIEKVAGELIGLDFDKV